MGRRRALFPRTGQFDQDVVIDQAADRAFVARLKAVHGRPPADVKVNDDRDPRFLQATETASGCSSSAGWE